MKHYADTSTQDPAGMTDKFPCPGCCRETVHEILSIVNSSHSDEYGWETFLENYLTVRCNGCGEISFSHVSKCTSEEDYTEDGMPYLPQRKKHYPEMQPIGFERKFFINDKHILEIEVLPKDRFDTTKLKQLLIELNRAYEGQSYFSCLMLVRAIVDHVPPIFGKETFAEVANNYKGGGHSFRESMKHLEASCRKLADGSLHSQIRRKESVPTLQQVEFRADTDALIGEVIRVLRDAA